jgi:hypothetical protein
MNILVNIGSQFNLTNFFFKHEPKVAIWKRTVIAGRFGVGNIFGSNAPFFEFQDQWSPGRVQIGGKQSLRGYRANRF